MASSYSSGEAMETVEIELGACFTADEIPKKFTFKWPIDNTMRRGSIKVVGSNRVIFGWSKIPENFDDSDEINKAYADQGVAVRIPRKCNWFVAVTGSGSSKCIEIED